MRDLRRQGDAEATGAWARSDVRSAVFWWACATYARHFGVIVFFLQIDTLAQENSNRDKHLQNRLSRTFVLSVQIDTLPPARAVHATGASNAPPICFARRRSSECRYMEVVDKDACRRLSRTVVNSAPR